MRIIVEATPIAIIVVDDRGTIVLANGHAQLLFGYAAGDLLGRNVEFLVPERFRAAYAVFRDRYALAPVGRLMDPGQELFGLRKDGVEVPIEIGLNPVRTRHRTLVLAAIVDITDRLSAEERSHADEQMRLVVDGSCNAMVVTDGNGRITLVNRQVERMFGYLRQELLDRSVEILIPERFRGEHVQHLAGHNIALDTLAFDGREMWGLHKDGRELPIEIALSPLVTSRGEFRLASIIDINERNRVEELRATKAAHAAEVGALHAEVESCEESLEESETEVRRQASRLESLWRIVNTPNLHGEELMLAMLREATAAIRPGHAYSGILGHIIGTEYVLDAVAGPAGDDASTITGLFGKNARVKRSETLFARDLTAGRTQSWHDCQADPNLPERAREFGVRSEIATQCSANGMVYVLALASREPPSETAFGPADYAYIEILGSFFGRELEQERLDTSLRAAEARTRQHAQRLAALWQVANNPQLRGQDLMFAMLRQAAAAFRPNQRFNGILGRVEGDEVVVIGVGIEAGAAGGIKIGRRTPLAQTMVPSTRGTQAWNDVTALSPGGADLAFLGWRSAMTTQFEAGGSRYWLIFGSAEPTTTAFDSEDSAYIGVVASSFANQLQVSDLEGSLRDEEERSREHAMRLEALRKIVNNPDLRDRELVQAMLGQAAASIRPGQNYRGVLWSIDGTELEIEAVASGEPILDDFPAVGTKVPLDSTVFGAVVTDGRGTRSWDGFMPSVDSSLRAWNRNAQSLIITTFRVGATNWILSFACRDPARSPLGPQDHAYAEVLASFFANSLQQSWQFERIRYQQSHDVLTGLLSRSYFRSQARAAARAGHRYAIILVNIDAFREVNETRGHMIGDAVLVEVGNALRKRAVGAELVGRIEGDVFGIFVPDPSSDDALAGRTLDFAGAFATAFSTGDRNGTDVVARTCSIGLAVAPKDGTLIDELLSHAGAALARAKERGHGTIVSYEAGMEGDVQRRAAFLTELSEAVTGNQFTLYYQPHIEIATGKVSGCEALIRWNHPVRGLLLPGEFIPFAERNGIIGSIDNWVMHKALSAANELSKLQPGLRVYFNLSGRQAGDPKVIRAFIRAAREGVILSNIGVEITESDAMRNVEATRQVCRALRRLGVRIAIDDFGTGYSSLSSLKRLPVDIVKIDQSFVSGILTNPQDAVISDTIISISKNFGFDSLAEGVENIEELAWLREHSCRYVQGFAICRPLPIEAFETWLTMYPKTLAAHLTNAAGGSPSIG